MHQRPRISLALALAIGAALLPLAILAGWSFDVALLRGLGAPSRPIHPMTAFSFFLMASAGILSSMGLRRPAQALLIFPLIYLLLILIQHLSGLDSGISRMLFAETMASSAALQRPITPMGAVAVLAALLAALFLRSSGSAMARAWVGQVTGIAVAATLLLLTFTVATQFSAGARFIGVAAASAVPILLLCGSILASLEMVRSTPHQHTPWDTLQRIQPLIIVCSVVPALVLIGLRQRAVLSDAELYFLIAMANLVVLAALLSYVTHRASRQNRMLAGGEAKLHSILGTAPDALIITGDDLVIRTYSASTPLMWRCGDTELTGQSLHALFEAPIDTFETLVRTPSGTHGGATITTGRRSDDTSFPAELRLGIAEQEGERVCVAFVRDLSERMSMEDQLNGLSFQLMHLSRQNAMGELAGDIAHEINQPLTAATNYASTAAYVLDQRGDTDKAREHLKEVSTQLLRAGGIISRLRAFLANREIELRREPLEAVVQDAVNLVRIGSRRVAGRLTVDIPPDTPPVYVDRIQIQQVLVNLLRNSFEACDESGREARIDIVARQAGDHLVEIEVSDNGAGLPEGFAERLGQRFSSTKGETGLGIGLNISKRIVEAHGGTLVAESRQPHGAVFRFTVPALGDLPQL
ncbi:sensor histidine kinase [Sphingomonas sp.]|jgi:signal transduction histidine kinase|uniref:sensor histidine kinase n=1 Tax=Sphingomonas sp. TaxID=28214 RepID=UPI002E0FA662|nr:ATP-binding protein [Sphingomonas sp.]